MSIPKSKDEKYMELALSLAKKAAKIGEVPVGAVLVRNDEIIAQGYNLRENSNCATSHAEVVAIEEACRKLKSWRLSECELYVTLEPCPMCAGAIINSRIKRVIFGAKDPRMGSLGSMIDMNSYPLGHKVQITQGIYENECLELMREFFNNNRKNKKDN